MVNYDSDTSEEGNEYTTTNVILGYASTESSGDDISHIGGHPIWLEEQRTPPASLSKCRNCNGYLSLLLQLNADLQQHFPHDSRRIFVLSCKNKPCLRKPGSVRAFREVKKPQARKQNTQSLSNNTTASSQTSSSAQGPNEGLGSLLFGSTSGSSVNANTNPSSASAASSTHVNPFSRPSTTTSNVTQAQPSEDSQPPVETFTSKLSLKDPEPTGTKTAEETVEPWPAQLAFPDPFPHFYLDAFPEELDPTPSPRNGEASATRVQYDVEDTAGAAGDKDTFESSLDKTFQRFSDLVGQNPEQVLRYEFKGQPLLYAGNDAVSSRFVVPHGKAGAVKGIPRCDACGSQRVFELQLMPYLIFEIEKDAAMDINEGMEWGTIIVGTCANNCGDDGMTTFREEWVGSQWEERVSRK